MITDGMLMVGVILALSAGLIVLEKSTGWRLFKYVPGMVLMYLVCAAANSLGLFSDDEAARAPLGEIKSVLLPAMILLFLFGCDLRKIIRLGPKLLLTFFVASASIVGGMILVYAIFRSALADQAWKVLGALVASWTGGSPNMVAVQDILKAPQNLFGYALITDTIVYSLWLLVMFGSVGFSDRFNRITKADTRYLETRHDEADADADRPVTLPSLALVVLGSLAVSIAATAIGDLLPEIGTVVNGTTWTILIVSVLGLLIALTPLGRTAGSMEVATLMLFVVIGQIASGSDFSAFTQAPIYLVMGVLMVVFHAAVMVVYAKLTRTELFSLAVASTANIGGIASAPVVASAYNRQLVPVGVLYALIGSFMGTFVGLFAAQVMSAL